MSYFSKRQYLAASAKLADYSGPSKPEVIHFLLDLFANDNAQFNKARFVVDCGGFSPRVSETTRVPARVKR